MPEKDEHPETEHSPISTKDVFDGTLDRLSRDKKQEIIKGLLNAHPASAATQEGKETITIPEFAKHTFRVEST